MREIEKEREKESRGFFRVLVQEIRKRFMNWETLRTPQIETKGEEEEEEEEKDFRIGEKIKDISVCKYHVIRRRKAKKKKGKKKKNKDLIPFSVSCLPVFFARILWVTFVSCL